MIICHCKGKTHRDIAAASNCGARNLAEVAKNCGAGSACGGCTPLIESLIVASKSRKTSNTVTKPNS